MNFDYIVVGAGSAGAVVAGRLAELPAVKVLLIEAGGHGKDLSVRIPAGFSKQFGTDLDWNYRTEPEPHLDGRSLYHPRGRMLGGCSGQNAMIYIRGNRRDYDGWADAGAKGWSYDEVLPVFKRSERNSRGASAFHGADGPLFIEDPRSLNPFTEHLLDGMTTSGFAANDDFNGPDQMGVGTYQLTQRRGRRWTTADGFLRSAGTNLTIWTDAVAQRVVIEHGRAVGVEVERNGARETARATSEVVLSAGAFGSPHLLMLSGIGPAAHLREHGIDVIVDNEHVGSHLMDHPMYLMNFETSAKGTLFEAEKPAELVKYFTRRRGMLTSNVAEAGGFFRTGAGSDPLPDLQFVAAPGFFWNNGFDTHPTPAYALGLSLVGSISEGTVRLRTANASDHPAIRFNYFAERQDMDAMITAVEAARGVAAAGSLGRLTGKELHPGSDHITRADIEAEIRRNVLHTYHPACSARMGSENDGVVGATLEVHGISGLRVADASVFPRITHGNTHAPSVLVGEMAAEFVTTSAS